jgi:hypothetical protein
LKLGATGHRSLIGKICYFFKNKPERDQTKNGSQKLARKAKISNHQKADELKILGQLL